MRETGRSGQMEQTRSERIAERAATIIGSWRFLIAQSGVLALWLAVNGLRIAGFDPPPYILLNLVLSFQAAFTGPILLIAANVAARRDRAQASRIEHFAAHLERLAAFDHEEHGRLLRDLHTHTLCAGHTVIETAAPAAAAAAAAAA